MAVPQQDISHLRDIIALFQAGSALPVRPMERLIAADEGVDPLLVDLLRSRAVRDDSWAPLWAIIVLGERRAVRCASDILGAMRDGNSLLHEAVEFAMLRFGDGIVDLILQFLDENPGLEGRLNLYGVLSHYRTPRAIEFLIAQLRRDEDCVGSVAWALAESRHPAAIAALRAAALRSGADPEIREALKAATGPLEDLNNPLLEDWRKHWVWQEDDEEESPSEAPTDELAWGDPENDLELTPRYYDLSCPICSSRLEYDTHEDDVHVLKYGRAPRERKKSKRE